VLDRVRLKEKFQLLLDEFPKLTLEQLKEIEGKLAISKSLKQPTNVNDGELEQFHKRLTYKLLTSNGSPEAPFNTIKKTSYYKKLISAHDFVVKFLEIMLKPTKPTKVYKEAIFVLYANLMHTYQKKIPNFPVSLETLVNTYDKFPDLVDRAYPGYVRSGVGIYIFSVKQNPGDLKV
jgi:hypothetical protein